MSATKEIPAMHRRSRKSRISAKPCLDKLATELDAAAKGIDPEATHDLRSTLARIRVWLELAKDDALVERVRDLRKAAAPVRDADVALAEHPSAAEAHALKADRVRARRDFLFALRRAKVPALVDAIADVQPIEPRRAKKRLRRFAERTLERGDCLRPRNRERIHALRRSVRRLRYGLEWLGAPDDELARLQKKLGKFSDAWIACRRAQSDPQRPTRSEQRALDERVRRAARSAVRAWKRGKKAVRKLA